MGKMKGAAERRGDEAPAPSQAGGRSGGRLQPRVKGGVRAAWRGKKNFCGFRQ